jgi:hypothetical protein
MSKMKVSGTLICYMLNGQATCLCTMNMAHSGIHIISLMSPFYYLCV